MSPGLVLVCTLNGELLVIRIGVQGRVIVTGTIRRVKTSLLKTLRRLLSVEAELDRQPP